MTVGSGIAPDLLTLPPGGERRSRAPVAAFAQILIPPVGIFTPP